MAYILEARSEEDQMPRMVWIESTGRFDEVRLVFANAFGIMAKGIARAEDLESLATAGGHCVCSGDLWIERTDNLNFWRVTLANSATLGTLHVNAYDLTCGLQHLRFDRYIAGEATTNNLPSNVHSANFGVPRIFHTARAVALD